jgi:hypothetical protein
MTFSKLLAKQLGNPSRISGKLAAIVWNRRNAALNDVVFDVLDLEPSNRVLEIGFGGGYLVLCFTSKESLAKRNFEGDFRLVEADEIQALMAANGFKSIRSVCSSDQYREFICVNENKSPDGLDDVGQVHNVPEV